MAQPSKKNLYKYKSLYEIPIYNPLVHTAEDNARRDIALNFLGSQGYHTHEQIKEFIYTSRGIKTIDGHPEWKFLYLGTDCLTFVAKYSTWEKAVDLFNCSTCYFMH